MVVFAADAAAAAAAIAVGEVDFGVVVDRVPGPFRDGGDEDEEEDEGEDKGTVIIMISSLFSPPSPLSSPFIGCISSCTNRTFLSVIQ